MNILDGIFPYVLEKLQYNQTDEMGELKTINRNYYVGFVWNISWSDFALRKLQLKQRILISHSH